MKIEKIQDKHLIEYQKFNPKKPKHLQLEKVCVLMKEEHKSFLDYISRVIKSKRCPNKKNERITGNSIVRSLIDFLISNHNDLDFSNIHTEEDLISSINKFHVLK